MPIYQARYTLGTASATQIVAPDVEPQQVWIHEADHSASTELYIGNSSVTASTGLHLHAAETINITVNPNDGVYAISGQGAPTVHVLRVTQH